MTADANQRLMELLGPPDRAVDLMFVSSVDQHVLLEQRLRRARLLAWRKFGKDLALSSLVVCLILVLVGLGRSGAAGPLAPVMSSSTFALFIFAIWAAAALRPSYSNG